MVVCSWLLKRQALEGCDTSNWHKQLQWAHQERHPLDRDQVQYLRDQLAHREAQLRMLGQNEILILSKKNYLHTCVYSAAKQAKDWKSRVVNEAEQALVRESAEAAQRTNEVQEAMDKQFQARGREAAAQLRDTRESNSAQATTRS